MPTIPHARTNLPPITHGNDISLPLQSVLSADPASMGYSPMMASALGYARSGYNVIPLMPGTKHLDASTGFRHGRDARFPTYADVLDLWEANPDRNVGISPHPTTILVDVDTKNGARLEDVERMGLDVHNVQRDRTTSGGWHLWYRLPDGFFAQKGASGAGLPAGIELLGPRGFAVSPHSIVSGNWYRRDPDGGAHFGQVPDTWPLLDRLLDPATGAQLSQIRTCDRNDATRLVKRMRGATEFKDAINGLFARSFKTTIITLDPTLDRSPSGRDFLLVLMASHFLRDNPRRAHILFALLWQTGWPEQKATRKPGTDPEEYCSDTVAEAIAVRDTRDTDRLTQLRQTLVLSPGLVPTPGYPPLLDGTPPLECRELDMSILGFAASSEIDGYTRNDRWRRIPVQDFAALHGVDRRTVTRRLKALKDRGQIERHTPAYTHDGQTRRDSLVRLVDSRSERSAA